MCGSQIYNAVVVLFCPQIFYVGEARCFRLPVLSLATTLYHMCALKTRKKTSKSHSSDGRTSQTARKLEIRASERASEQGRAGGRQEEEEEARYEVSNRPGEEEKRMKEERERDFFPFGR